MANSVDPDQTAPPQEQSDLGLHFSHMLFCQRVFYVWNFRTITVHMFSGIYLTLPEFKDKSFRLQFSYYFDDQKY